MLERELGPDHPSLGEVLENFANATQRLGRTSEAREPPRRAVEISIGTSLGAYAYDLRQLGRYEEALPAIAEATRILEATAGPDHPQTATMWSSWALLEQMRGKPEHSPALAERALTLEAQLGTGHPFTTQARVVRAEEARRILETRAADLRHHPLEFCQGCESVFPGLAELAVREGDFPRATSLAREAIGIEEARWPTGNPAR